MLAADLQQLSAITNRDLREKFPVTLMLEDLSKLSAKANCSKLNSCCPYFASCGTQPEVTGSLPGGVHICYGALRLTAV